MKSSTSIKLPAIKSLYEIAVYSQDISVDICDYTLVSCPIWTEIFHGYAQHEPTLSAIEDTNLRQYLLFLSLMVVDLPISPFGTRSAQDEIIFI